YTYHCQLKVNAARPKLTTAKVKKDNDEVWIQALVDGKRVNIKESSIRRIQRLDDAEGTSCLTNTMIFKGLARMRYILLSLIKNIEAGVPFFMFSRFVQLIINHQLGDMTLHKDIFDTSSLTKKIFANMKRVGTGFFREVTLLFDNMLVQALEEVGILQADAQPIPIPTEPSPSKPQKKHKPKRKHTKEPEELMDLRTNLSNKVLDLESEVIDIKSTFKAKIEKLESKGRKISDINANVEINLKKVQAEAYNLDLDHQEKVLSMLDVNEEEPADVEEVLEVVTTAKLITKVATTDGVDVNNASVQVVPFTIAEATKVTVEVPKPRKKKESSKREGKSLEQEIEKKQKIEQETKELKKHLRIVSDDDDVYADATPLALKILIVDYKIHTERNRLYFKIIRVDGNHKLFMSFSTMMNNFDIEDLESFWKIVRERFEKTEPKNYSNDYLLNTL
nr:hypothetical protein [Tanacetum cinerariifolium]